jgi:xylulokinase
VTSETLLGIDIGTSSTKGVLASPDGTIVAEAQRQHTLSLPWPGWAEHDAEVIWWDDVRAIVRDLMPSASGLRAVCVSGIGPCLLPCDDNNRPLRPAILYGIDTRASDEISQLEHRYGAEAILARSGTKLSSQAIGPKLLWLRRHEEDVWSRLRRWHMASSFIVARLTGEYVLDHHSASQSSPLYDLHAGAWAEDWSSDIAPHLPLPRLAWPAEQVGEVTREASEITGLPQGIPVMAGTIDAWAEAFSAGVRQTGDLMLMYGSTAFLVQAVDHARPHELLWCTRGAEPGSYTFAAGTSTSGTLTEWMRDLFGEVSWDHLIAEAATVPPGANGLLVLPHFAGERTPLYDPSARGVIVGLTLSHRRADLMRATYEGIAFGIRTIIELLSQAAGPPRLIRAVGGGTLSPLWMQIVSDVCDVTQSVPSITVGASYGDALLAAIGADLVQPSCDWSRTSYAVTPNPRDRDGYAALYKVYEQLYAATRRVSHQLAAIQQHLAPLRDSDTAARR